MSCDSTYKEKSSASGQPAQGEEKALSPGGFLQSAPQGGGESLFH